MMRVIFFHGPRGGGSMCVVSDLLWLLHHLGIKCAARVDVADKLKFTYRHSGE
jgi:hypothetical protein